MVWKKQGPAVSAPLALKSGKKGRVVLVAGRDNPRGAVIVLPGAEPGAVETLPLANHIEQLTQVQLVEILAMQERVFGQIGLAAPELP